MKEVDFKVPREKDELNAFVDSVSLHFDELQKTVSRTQLSNHAVIENASGGLALSGIYLDNLNNNYKKSRTVLELKDKDSICLKQSIMTQMDKTETFNEFEKYDEHTRNVETLGVTLSGKLKASFLASSVETGAYFNRQNDKKENKQRNSQKTYFCREKSCTVPVKSFEMTPDKVCLTPQAISRLKAIEELISLKSSTEFIHAECLRFFKEFGSFVNIGTLEFGGTYKWKATYESELKSDEKITSEALTTILTGYVNAGMSFGQKSAGVAASGDFMSEEGKLQLNQQDNSHTTLQTNKVGGPTEVENFHIWRYGLLSFNSTWSLLDRGDLVGIWDIVCTQTTDFANSGSLSCMLNEAWVNKKDILNKDFRQENDLQNKLKFIMQELKEWSQKEEPNIANCYPILQKLNTVKQQRLEVLKLERDSFVITNETIKTFFKRIVQQKKCFDETTVQLVKHIMRQILNPFCPEEMSACYSVSAWLLPDKQTVTHLRFSNEIKDLQSFVFITETKFVPYIKCIKLQQSVNADYITTEFQEICKSCLINMKENETFLDIILMTAVLLPFGFDILKSCFSRRLNVTCVDDIKDEVKLLLQMQETVSPKSRIEVETSMANLFIKNLRGTGNFDKDEESVFEIYLSPIRNSERYTKEFRKLLSCPENASQSKLNVFEVNLKRFETSKKNVFY
ncbi:unnamed protein product [Mytilus edulis]|uniref:MACPF domain-containing protein n=1 Tax=Mytilus edulis TaxID=6550 RepID=A0A8S3UZ13_MYTED|nr:unnamed protein product [Mytilus edulis]